MKDSRDHSIDEDNDLIKEAMMDESKPMTSIKPLNTRIDKKSIKDKLYEIENNQIWELVSHSKKESINVKWV